MPSGASGQPVTSSGCSGRGIDGAVTIADGRASSVPAVVETSVGKIDGSLTRIALLEWIAVRSHEPELAVTAQHPSGVMAIPTGSAPTDRPFRPGVKGSESLRSAALDARLAMNTSPRAVSRMKAKVVGEVKGAGPASGSPSAGAS